MHCPLSNQAKKRTFAPYWSALRVAKDHWSLYSVTLPVCRPVPTREDEYLEVAGRYSKDELNDLSGAMACMVMEMERKPFTDILGVYYCEVQSKFTRDAGGEFYTPQEVGKLMAKISVNAPAAIEAGKPITMNDPASGSGGLILSVAEEFAEAGAVDLIRATCQDISKTACDMAYINTTLWGIPARVIWGNTLSNTVRKRWENIHWHRVGEPMRERVKAMMQLFPSEPVVVPAVQPDNDAPDLQMKTNAAGQQEWLFQ